MIKCFNTNSCIGTAIPLFKSDIQNGVAPQVNTSICNYLDTFLSTTMTSILTNLTLSLTNLDKDFSTSPSQSPQVTESTFINKLLNQNEKLIDWNMEINQTLINSFNELIKSKSRDSLSSFQPNLEIFSSSSFPFTYR